MIGNGISNVGSWMQLVAQPWLVLTLSGSSFLVGVDNFAGHVPSFLFLILGGVYADRKSRRQIMVVSQIVQLVSAALIAGLLVWGKIQVWMIIALSFCVGTAQAFSFPAYQALVTTLVPREYLPNAIALNSVVFNMTRVIGPMLAGVTMAAIGAAWCFGLNSLSFIALLIVLFQIETSQPTKSALQSPAGASAKVGSWHEGLNKVYRDKPMLVTLLLVFIVTSFCGPVFSFLPVIVKNMIHGNASTFSHSAALFGVGALFGALGIAALNLSNARSLTLKLLLLLAALEAGVAFTSQVWILNILLFITGAAFVACTTAANTSLQTSTTNEFRGRTASFFLLSMRAGMALGSLLSGWAIDQMGVKIAFTANAVIAIVFGLGAWRLVNTAGVRQINQPE